jgi:N-carbamoylputrescine amidase
MRAVAAPRPLEAPVIKIVGSDIKDPLWFILVPLLMCIVTGRLGAEKQGLPRAARFLYWWRNHEEVFVRVTVCQLRVDREHLDADWARLVAHVVDEESDLVLLPEMPFYPWPFTRPGFDAAVWSQTVQAHARWLARLAEMAPAVVAGSRPSADEPRLNKAFVWTLDQGERSDIHSKYYLPDEEGFWEASWYARGDGRFQATPVTLSTGQSLSVGFLICTELWFMQQARAYGQAGIQLLLTPRATERRTVDKWLAGGRAAAVIAGAYGLSSNHYHEGTDEARLGGQGWIVDPDGAVLGITSPETPFVTATIDPQRADAAKASYPRYVRD